MTFEQRKQDVIQRIDQDPSIKSKGKLDEFSLWLDKTKEWVDYEKQSFVMDARMLWNTFQIYFKITHTDQHHIELVSGSVGKGKSTFAWQRAALIDENLGTKNLIYTYEDLLTAISTFPRGSVVWFDEGGDIFDSASSITRDARSINKWMRKLRYCGFYVVICFDDPRQMQWSVMSKADSIIYKTYNPKGKDQRDKHKGLRFYGRSSVEFIASEMKKRKRDILTIKTQFMDGHNSAARPVVNDLNEESYSATKDLAVRSAAQEELLKIQQDKPQPTEPEVNDGLTYMKLSEARKILPLTTDTYKKRINEGLFRGKKVGLLYFVAKEDILS